MAQDGTAGDVNVSGSQGVVAGTGNTQNNNWHLNPLLDPAIFRSLSPHAAVDRIRQIRHDDVVDLFGRALVEDVTEVLEALRVIDGAMVVAILADVNRRKATELIATLHASGQWMAGLPEASEAIARKAAELKWDQAGKLERVEDGYARKYEKGIVFWSPDQGVHTASGLIEIYWIGQSDFLGIPYGDEETAPPSPQGTKGTLQRFDGIVVYASRHGTYVVDWRCNECHFSEGGTAGWLGFPAANIVEVGDRSCIQRFEGGTICYLDDANVYAVRSELLKHLPLMGRGSTPISKEVATVSSIGNAGRMQRFLVNFGKDLEETAMYTSEAGFGVIMIDPGMWSYYHDMGAESSWLGFPTKHAQHFESGMRIQSFEDGAIYWRHKTGSIAVPRAVLEFILQDKGKRGKVGYPTSEEQPIGDGSDRIQFFDKGAVTLRDGKREIWMRPDQDEPPPELPKPPPDWSGGRALAAKNARTLGWVNPYPRNKSQGQPGG